MHALTDQIQICDVHENNLKHVRCLTHWRWRRLGSGRRGIRFMCAKNLQL